MQNSNATEYSYRNIIWFNIKSSGITNIQEFDYEKLKYGTVVGAGASGVVTKVELNNCFVAVKKFSVSNLEKNELEIFKREILMAKSFFLFLFLFLFFILFYYFFIFIILLFILI